VENDSLKQLLVNIQRFARLCRKRRVDFICSTWFSRSAGAVQGAQKKWRVIETAVALLISWRQIQKNVFDSAKHQYIVPALYDIAKGSSIKKWVETGERHQQFNGVKLIELRSVWQLFVFDVLLDLLAFIVEFWKMQTLPVKTCQ